MLAGVGVVVGTEQHELIAPVGVDEVQLHGVALRQAGGHGTHGQCFWRKRADLQAQGLQRAEVRQGLRTALPVNLAANLLLATAEGRIIQYVRSEFRRSPTDYWAEQWRVLTGSLFRRAGD